MTARSGEHGDALLFAENCQRNCRQYWQVTGDLVTNGSSCCWSLVEVQSDQEEHWAEEFGPSNDARHSLGVYGVNREEEGGDRSDGFRNRKWRHELVKEDTDDRV